jgi:hypothetical protein
MKQCPTPLENSKAYGYKLLPCFEITLAPRPYLMTKHRNDPISVLATQGAEERVSTQSAQRHAV